MSPRQTTPLRTRRRPARRRPASVPRVGRAAPLVLAALLVAVAVGAGRRSAAQEPSPRPDAAAPTRVLEVAIREAPPFAMRSAEGGWEGLSVALWERVAAERGWTFQWREMPLHETLDALEAGAVDVAIAALTITEERERHLDFSHAYYSGGLATAWRPASESAWLTALHGFAWRDFARVVGSLALVLLVAGTAVWLFERRANPQHFGDGSLLRGLGAGFWWSAVTMTTVGYGDKAPSTLGGRIVAIVWMFTSVVIVASFTGAIAASVTARRLDDDLLHRRPLSELRAGVLEQSSGAEYAVSQGARPRSFTDVTALLDALAEGNVDVAVHDAAILRYEACHVPGPCLRVSPEVLVRDDYGFGLPSGSPLREALNVSLLAVLHEPDWRETRRRYLGE